MRIARKIMTLAVPLYLIISASSSFATDIPDEQITPGSIAQGDTSSKYGVFFEESVDTLRMPTLLYGYRIRNNQMDAVDFCRSTSDAACAEATNFKYYALFPPCATSLSRDCIESVYAIESGSSNKILGEYVRTMPETVARSYEGDSKYGIPKGGNAGIWRLPGVRHKGGAEDYAVVMSQIGDVSKNSDTNFPEFRAAILPVNVVANPGYKANIAVINDMGSPGYKHVGINHVGTVNFEPCAIVEDGSCALRQSFPNGYQFGMSIRFSRSISGWLHGRISSPQIEYELKSPGTRIQMQGEPISVPVVGGWIDSSKFTDIVKKEFQYIPNIGSGTFPGASGNDSMKSLVAWAKLLDDKAIASPTQWIFYNLPEYQMQSSNLCIRSSKSLAGFVTTNSTTYAAGPPIFNPETQSLDYKVASAHYLKDGSVFKGEYNLYIDSKVARCIYKFSSAPISASISIVNDSGEAKVATTTMTESNGWIHLTAVGFTFSSPTLKVKLSQANVEVAAQVQASTPVNKVTITCIKGKNSKKVTAMKPACPSGWKKK